MDTFAFMLKRFVWKTKVCHPSVENQPALLKPLLPRDSRPGSVLIPLPRVRR